MPNDLATLRSKLAVAVSDPTFGYWTSAEMDGLIEDAVRNLWPRYGSRVTTQGSHIALVENQRWYTLPAGMVEVDDVYLLDAAGDMIQEMPVGTWLTHINDSVAQIEVNPAFITVGPTLRVSGLARYNTSTVLIPDDLVDLVIATARAEAYRRALGDRMRFKQWATKNQTSNVSVNEMLGIINESERKAAEMRAHTPRSHRRPVPARV